MPMLLLPDLLGFNEATSKEGSCAAATQTIRAAAIVARLARAITWPPSVPEPALASVAARVVATAAAVVEAAAAGAAAARQRSS